MGSLTGSPLDLRVNRAVEIYAVEFTFDSDKDAKVVWTKGYFFNEAVAFTKTSDKKLVLVGGLNRLTSIEIVDPQSGTSLRTVGLGEWVTFSVLVGLNEIQGHTSAGIG